MHDVYKNRTDSKMQISKTFYKTFIPAEVGFFVANSKVHIAESKVFMKAET